MIDKDQFWNCKFCHRSFEGDGDDQEQNLCKIGEGDCDDDYDCLPGLMCGQRDNFTNPDPGLYGYKVHGVNDHVDDDYCYDPKSGAL